MQMKRTLTVLAALAVTVSVAAAQDTPQWRVLGVGDPTVPGSTALSYNVGRTTRSGNLLNTWVKYFEVTPVTFGAIFGETANKAQSSALVQYVEEHLVIDCAGNTTATLATYVYGTVGNVIDGFAVDSATQKETIPGSKGDDVVRLVCAATRGGVAK